VIVWLAAVAVKAERSEFILSLDGLRNQSQQGTLRAKENMTFSFSVLVFTFHRRQSSLSCRHPSIRTLGERLMRSVHIGVLVTVGAAF
jgi:hypothetical protein